MRRKVDRSRGLKSAAEDEHAGDGNDRWMPEALEGGRRSDEAKQDGREQRSERHHVVPPSTPDEHEERAGQDREDLYLFALHRSPVPETE